MAAREGRSPKDFLPRDFYRLTVHLDRALDLRVPETRRALGISGKDIANDDPRLCQQIGKAAEAAGLEGILAPSATGTGDVLALFTDNLLPASTVKVEHVRSWDAETWPGTSE